MLDDKSFMRYSRQLLLEEIGPEGQQKLSDARILIVGLGGLGSPAALYLAAAGAGTLLLADDDDLHISNLQRQILYRTSDTGSSKAQLAAAALHALNPSITLHAIPDRIPLSDGDELPVRPTLVLDCSDNLATRHRLNAWCFSRNLPLITASAVGFHGQLLVLTPPWQHGCYQCLWPDSREPERNCRNSGIAGPVTGVMGSLQALEAIKWICSGRNTAAGQLMLFDGLAFRCRKLQLSPERNCPICGARHAN